MPICRLGLRSAAPQYYQPQPQQYQRVVVYSGPQGPQPQGQQALPAGVYPYPLSPAGSFLPLPLRAEEGGSGGSGAGSGGSWGGFNPSEYLTVLQNYWQNFAGSTQSGKPPTEGASPSPSAPSGAGESPGARTFD